MSFSTQTNWQDYQLLDSGNGQRLEKWGVYTLVRPDVNAYWKPHLSAAEWHKADATFTENGKTGQWIKKKEIPESWLIEFQGLHLLAKLTPFKHTGIFPEQAPEWMWIKEKIASSDTQLNILNLFAYTGVATLIAASAGAKVTHVDASKPSVTWMRQNQEASGLLEKPIRFIVDDVLKFTQREVKRGAKYDGIIMDPPLFGHGAKGERWQLTKHLPVLLDDCRMLFSENPQFVLINTYSSSVSDSLITRMMRDAFGKLDGTIKTEPLFLTEQGGRVLKTGIVGKWTK